MTVSRPVGGILSSPRRGLGDHPSVRPTWGLPTCVAASGRTGRPCPTLGLAPSGVYRAGPVTRAAGALLPHRFTLTCAVLARGPGPPSAVCSLWHFPADRPDWPLASTLPCGVPTFLEPCPTEVSLPPERTAATRPAHRPSHVPTDRGRTGHRVTGLRCTPFSEPTSAGHRATRTEPVTGAF
jgi:hypothetical protein